MDQSEYPHQIQVPVSADVMAINNPVMTTGESTYMELVCDFLTPSSPNFNNEVGVSVV